MEERPAYAVAASDVLQRLQSDVEVGLRVEEAAIRLRQCGKNRLAVAAGTPRWKRLLSSDFHAMVGQSAGCSSDKFAGLDDCIGSRFDSSNDHRADEVSLLWASKDIRLMR